MNPVRTFLAVSLPMFFRFFALASDDYNPLEVGQERAITLIVEHQTTERTLHSRVESTVERNGKKYFRIREKYDNLPGDKTVLFRSDEKGIYSLDESNPNAVEIVQCLLPFKIGAVWERTRGGKATVTEIGIENVKIGDKAYENCYHMRSTSPTPNGDVTNDYWYAPNVGWIKSITLIPSGETLVRTLKTLEPSQ